MRLPSPYVLLLAGLGTMQACNRNEPSTAKVPLSTTIVKKQKSFRPALRVVKGHEKWTLGLIGTLDLPLFTTFSFYKRSDIEDSSVLGVSSEGSLFVISRIVFFKVQGKKGNIVMASKPVNYLGKHQYVKIVNSSGVAWIHLQEVKGQKRSRAILPWPSSSVIPRQPH